MLRKMSLAAAVAVSLAGCVSTSVIPLSKNTARVVVECSLCSVTDVQHHAFYHAATTTLKCGYDEFVIQTIESGQRGTAGSGYYEEMPHGVIIIGMYKAGDSPEAGSGFDARQILGEHWEEIVQRHHRVVALC